MNSNSIKDLNFSFEMLKIFPVLAVKYVFEENGIQELIACRNSDEKLLI